MFEDLTTGARVLAWLAMLGLALLVTGWVMEQVHGRISLVTKR